VLGTLVQHAQFTLKQLKGILPDESAAYITRLVHELEQEGQLRQDEQGVFRWTGLPCEFPIQAWIENKVYVAPLPQTPPADRPRERLLALGAPGLRTAELLAILIRVGRTGESALQAGKGLPHALRSSWCRRAGP
jgi:DNA repair protein RadC